MLVDAGELAWQRARCRGNHHIFAPADPVLVGLTTLQHWLWQRLKAPVDPDSAGDGNTRNDVGVSHTTVNRPPDRRAR